MKLRKVQNKFH